MSDVVWQGQWVVTRYRLGDEMVAPDQAADATLLVDGDRVSGTMGVNRFMGGHDGEVFGTLATTMMAGPEHLMTQEQVLLGHLESADHVEVIGDGMFLSRDGLLLVELVQSGTE